MFYFILITLFLITDQVSKFFTVKYLNEYQSVPVIDGILDFTHVHNTGGPWSIFKNTPFIFVIMTVVIFVLGFFYLKKHKPSHLLEKISLCLIAGGALGNLTDRLLRGHVIDMIDVNFFNYPVFNLADCYIVVGAILMCAYIIFFEGKNKQSGE